MPTLSMRNKKSNLKLFLGLVHKQRETKRHSGFKAPKKRNQPEKLEEDTWAIGFPLAQVFPMMKDVVLDQTSKTHEGKAEEEGKGYGGKVSETESDYLV